MRTPGVALALLAGFCLNVGLGSSGASAQTSEETVGVRRGDSVHVEVEVEQRPHDVVRPWPAPEPAPVRPVPAPGIGPRPVAVAASDDEPEVTFEYAPGLGPCYLPEHPLTQLGCIPIPAEPADPADPTTTAGPPRITSLSLLRRAVAQLAPPAPRLHLNPVGDQIAQLPSWLWVDAAQWRPVSATASVGSVSATARLDPLRVRWSLGNGDVVVCDGPGRPYEPRYADTPEATDCKYTWRHSSANQPDETYTVTAMIEWAASWSGSDGAGGPLGTLTTAAGTDVRVAEIQALVQ